MVVDSQRKRSYGSFGFCRTKLDKFYNTFLTGFVIHVVQELNFPAQACLGLQTCHVARLEYFNEVRVLYPV